MVKSVPIEEFLRKAAEYPILDVRTPLEFEAGHIPGAFNMPLFSNEERVIVGTIYKQQGRETAILKGLELIGPRMADIIRQAEEIAGDRKQILTHCWRGGMRSGSVAWLLGLYGFRVFTLEGGYKSFRKWIIDRFSIPYPIIILGGHTGSKKTEVLHQLKAKGEQVLDLEALANHKGSAFGAIGEQPQPSQEQFENLTGMRLAEFDTQKRIWVEDESRMIGKKVIPDALWLQMRENPVLFLDIDLEERVKYLVTTYGTFPQDKLEESILKIEKRLGGLDTKLAVEALQKGELDITAAILLRYYDKTYTHGLSKREADMVYRFKPQNQAIPKIADELIQYANRQKLKTFNP